VAPGALLDEGESGSVREGPPPEEPEAAPSPLDAPAPGGEGARPIWESTEPGSLDRHVAQYLYDVETGLAGAFPGDIEDLGSMTLREVVERFGSFGGLRDAVRGLRDFADMQNKQGLALQRRGELISRNVVTASVIPLIDLAFTRLVTEAPTALAEQVIARVQSASGSDLRIDVEDLIRSENSGILSDCRDSLVREFAALATAGDAE
jgi:hypothetical protein